MEKQKRLKRKLNERKRLTKKVLKENCEKKFYKKKYFDKETEFYVIKFINAHKKSVKDRLFVENIMPAFNELINNLIRTYKVYKVDSNVENLRRECLDFMYMKLCNENFVPGKHKAFSYFNVVARNFFFQKYKDYMKLLNNELPENALGHLDEIKRAGEYRLFRGMKDDTLVEEIISCDNTNEFIQSLYNYKGKIKEKYKDNMLLANKYCTVVDGVCQLFKQSEELPSFKKKAIYLYLREMCRVDSRIITSVFNLLRQEYPQLSMAFDK